MQRTSVDSRPASAVSGSHPCDSTDAALAKAVDLWHELRARPRFGGSRDEHPPLIVSPDPERFAAAVQSAVSGSPGPQGLAVGDFVVFESSRELRDHADVYEYRRGEIGRVTAVGGGRTVISRLAGNRNQVLVADEEMARPPVSLAYAVSPSRALGLVWPGAVIAIASADYDSREAAAFWSLLQGKAAARAKLDLVWDQREFADERQIEAATREIAPRKTLADALARKPGDEASARALARVRAKEDAERSRASRLAEAAQERARIAAERERLNGAREEARAANQERRNRPKTPLAELKSRRATREADRRRRLRADRDPGEHRGHPKTPLAELKRRRAAREAVRNAERRRNREEGRVRDGSRPVDALATAEAHPSDTRQGSMATAVELYVERYRLAAALADDRLTSGHVRGTTRAARAAGSRTTFPHPPLIVTRDPGAFAQAVRNALVHEGLLATGPDPWTEQARRGRRSKRISVRNMSSRNDSASRRADSLAMAPAEPVQGDLVEFAADCPDGRYRKGDIARVLARFENGRIDVEFHIAAERKTGARAIVRKSSREPWPATFAYATTPERALATRRSGDVVVVADAEYSASEREALDLLLTSRAERGDRVFLTWNTSEFSHPAHMRSALLLDRTERAHAYGYELPQPDRALREERECGGLAAEDRREREPEFALG